MTFSITTLSLMYQVSEQLCIMTLIRECLQVSFCLRGTEKWQVDKMGRHQVLDNKIEYFYVAWEQLELFIFNKTIQFFEVSIIIDSFFTNIIQAYLVEGEGGWIVGLISKRLKRDCIIIDI
jgi:hypothetical protein